MDAARSRPADDTEAPTAGPGSPADGPGPPGTVPRDEGVPAPATAPPPTLDPVPGDLAELLVRLKNRRGSSYEALARRTGLTRSSIHRYCLGRTVPTSFAPVERIGLACGASRQELTELFHRWSRACPGATGTPAGSAPAAVAGPAPVPAPATGPGSTHRRLRLRLRGPLLFRGPFLLLVPLLVVLLVRTDGVGLDAVGLGTGRPEPRPTPQTTGPAWVSAPRTVPSDFFGVTMNSSTGTLPGFQVGALRLWDSGTRWSLVEPERGRYRWGTLDRLVDSATAAALPVLLTFAGTPDWASPFGPRSAYPDGSRTSPPDDLRDWDRFVRTVASRYRGRIDAYELWVMAPSPHFYTGTAQTLATMSRRAAEIIHDIDPEAKAVCPSMGEMWQPESQRFLRDFAAAGGYQDCDVAGVKLHQKSPGQTPESVLELVSIIDRTFHEAGVHPRLWNTGTTYRIATEARLGEKQATDYAVRFYLVGLFARYQREYFYNWGGHKIPIVLQAEGGPPTDAARAVARLQRWLVGARIHRCGNGRGAGLPDHVFECRFLIPGKEPETGRKENQAAVLWTDTGTAVMPATTAPRRLHELDGDSMDIPPGQTLHIGETPVLVVVEPPR